MAWWHVHTPSSYQKGSRYRPGLAPDQRAFWPFHWHCFDFLNCGDRAKGLRRIAVVLILASRTLVDTSSVLRSSKTDCWHLDVFLHCSAFFHVFLCAGHLLGCGDDIGGLSFGKGWVAMFLCTTGAAGVAFREPIDSD